MINTLRFFAIAEGISYLAFAVTMPLKYGLDILWPNKIVGWIHGGLFMVYIVLMTIGAFKYRWELWRWFVVMAASLIPFAPFYVEKKYVTATP
jgi:integral membrane protein